jgi:ribosomal protein S18 acetylase RimI-like enzyme
MITLQDVDFTNPGHAAAVILLLNEYALDPMGGGQALSDSVREQLPRRLQQRDDAVVILAFAGDEAVGLTIAFEGFSTFAARPLLNIHDIIVTHHYRGRGIAQQMLQRMEHIAVQRDCCKLTLEVLAGNVVAQSAYRKFGFMPYQLDERLGIAQFWQKTLN